MIPSISANPPSAQIWLLEDSPLEVKRATSALTQERHRVETFSDGAALVERIASHPELPDAVVLDWQLPGMSGLEVCRFLREQHDEASLPILMLTGIRSDNRDVVEGLGAGANDYLLKPYQATELVARIRTLVRIRRLYATAQAAEAQMRRNVEFEKQLIGIVSHDLRNPLAAITTGASVLLRRDEVDGFTAKSASRILTAADRMHRLIRDLLDFTQARLGSGIQIEPAPCNLHEIVRQAVEEIVAAHPDREIRISCEGEGEGAGSWDADRLAQVVTNLLANAVQHSPSESPVTVQCEGRPEEVTLSVHNRGDPIPPEVMAHLFEPMRRGQTGPDRNTRSVGLGLFIVQQLVSAHGGSIEASSTPEDGTTFKVRLPRRTEEGGGTVHA